MKPSSQAIVPPRNSITGSAVPGSHVTSVEEGSRLVEMWYKELEGVDAICGFGFDGALSMGGKADRKLYSQVPKGGNRAREEEE
jgi:hypothetical protein